MARKQRLDLVLVERGLAASRQQAQQLIRAGRVRSADQVLDKPGHDIAPDLPLEVEQPPRFVSRGGEKLVAALAALPIQVAGRVCLDGGISTGGFSDCLLQHGASRIYGIDVGYGQTAWSLRTDPRLVLRERTNLRHLTPGDLYGPEDPWPDLAVADLSFISLGLVLPARGALLAPDRREALLLVKPQFEVGRSRVGKGGVVRDPAAHVDAIEGVIRAGEALGWQAQGLVASPITGPAGNHEYLLWLGSGLGGDGAGDGPGPRPAGPQPSTAGDGDGEQGQGLLGAGPSPAGPERARSLDRSAIGALVAQTLASP
jgi:23S rRNA (cytidine1920-2'-O)/16S rRNA (cytidine1409-2'-O)-methyltransferase